jgi:hypothetical protein
VSSVDVVVPCYRYGHFLRECVESVLAQPGPRVRVLIIDDASPDNTGEVAAELAKGESRVSVVRHASNKGHIATYNEGIEWASADYMLILSADDYLLPGALTHSATLMDAYPEVGFTFGNVIELRDNRDLNRGSVDVITKAGWRILRGLEFIELSASRNIVPTPTAVVRTALQKRLGGYLKDLPHSGDMEMWLRLAAHASVGSLEACQAVYRRHSGNMSLNYMALLPDLQQRKAALDCFYRSCNFSTAQRLHQKALLSLGRDAVGLASRTFNEGKIEVSGQFSEFALGVCPQIKGSLEWAKLACKRRLGFRAWNALRPAFARIRQMALPLR